MQNSFSCLMYEGFLVCTASFKSANQHLNRIKIFDLVISIFFFFFLRHFLLDLCFGSLSCCKVHNCTESLTFSSTFTFWNYQEFIVDSVMVSWPGPAAAKKPQITAGMRFLCLNAVFGLSQTCLLLLCQNNLTCIIHQSKAQKCWFLSR